MVLNVKSNKESALKRKALIFEVYFYVLSLLFVVAITLLYYTMIHIPTQTQPVQTQIIKVVEIEPNNSEVFKISNNTEIIGYSYLRIPAVMNNSKPVYVKAEMFVTPGTGNIFINIKGTLLGEDTQHSIRKAIKYALEHEKLTANKYDFYVNIESDASVLTGPSAGGSFGVLAIAALRNKIPRQDVMMTGTLSSDGRIGISGKIYEKALASKIAGARIFLVPEGLSKMHDIKIKEDCGYFSGKKYCDLIEYMVPENISQKANIQVYEVLTIDDALKYFNI